MIESALKRRATRGLARRTVAQYKTTLRMALAWAERRSVVSRNVAAIVELPTNARPGKTGKAMTPDQVRAFLVAAVGTRLEAMWTLMVYLGVLLEKRPDSRGPTLTSTKESSTFVKAERETNAADPSSDRQRTRNPFALSTLPRP